jgi:hypothetical protein
MPYRHSLGFSLAHQSESGSKSKKNDRLERFDTDPDFDPENAGHLMMYAEFHDFEMSL